VRVELDASFDSEPAQYLIQSENLIPSTGRKKPPLHGLTLEQVPGMNRRGSRRFGGTPFSPRPLPYNVRANRCTRSRCSERPFLTLLKRALMHCRIANRVRLTTRLPSRVDSLRSSVGGELRLGTDSMYVPPNV
jgi:hypothetical protein